MRLRLEQARELIGKDVTLFLGPSLLEGELTTVCAEPSVVVRSRAGLTVHCALSAVEDYHVNRFEPFILTEAEWRELLRSPQPVEADLIDRVARHFRAQQRPQPAEPAPQGELWITIDASRYRLELADQYMTGAQLRNLPSPAVLATRDLYRVAADGEEDLLVRENRPARRRKLLHRPADDPAGELTVSTAAGPDALARKAAAVMNRLAKWRSVFAGWQLGTRPDSDPESQAVRDHREATILLRAELSAVTALLIQDDEGLAAVMVAGFCPMGCGDTLYTGAGGHITCGSAQCPNPAAVDEILGDREIEHVVEFTRENFTVRHPLRERVGDALFECQLHHQLSSLDGPPVAPGRYRATPHRPDAYSESYRPGEQRDGDPRTSGPGFGVTLHEDKLWEPLRWRRPRMVFVNSTPCSSQPFAQRTYRRTAHVIQSSWKSLTNLPPRP